MRNVSKALGFAGAIMGRRLPIEFEMTPLTVVNPSLSQLISLMTTEANRVFPRPSVLGLPSVLQLELTNKCNLNCPLCPSGRLALSRRLDIMPLSTYRSLMSEIGQGLSLLILWGWGEPLIHPDVPEMVRLAKKNGTAVITSTNGQLMTPELADRLVDSGLDAIVIAVDGATEETYQSYRIGGTLANALAALDMIYDAKSRKASLIPFVNLRMVVTRYNQHEVPLMRDIATEHKADLLTFRGVAMTDLWDDQDDARYAPTGSAPSIYRYVDGKRVRSGKYVCRRPWKRVTVACDGSVVPCEMDYTDSQAFGAFPRDGSFREIWNGERARDFRRSFVRDRMQFEFCSRCPFNDRVTEDSTVGKYDTKTDLFSSNLY